MSRRFLSAAILSLALLPFAGCAKNYPFIDAPADDVLAKTDGWGLTKLDPSAYPDMRTAWMDKTGLEQAINKSLQFLRKESSKSWYPSGNPGDTITHSQMAATMNDLLDLLRRNVTPDQFQQQLLTRYDVYTSVGFNGKGDVWFTGYYTPIFDGSRTRTTEYQYPIYSRPADLVTDPRTGLVQGVYPTRRELMASGRLRGNELLWFKKPIEPFLVQVQGSAQVRLTDGTSVMVGYSGSNGRDHVGLGMQLMQAGKLDAKHMSLPAVLNYYDKHPTELNEAILKDDRLSFQKIYTAAEAVEWPTGSLNAQVTTHRSIATDKNSNPAIFPRASFVFIDAAMPTGQKKTFVLDQDNGGGIRAAGRANYYTGIGSEAGREAGDIYAQGRLYYIFLKTSMIDPAKHPDAVAGAPRVPGPAPAPGASEMFPGAVTPR